MKIKGVKRMSKVSLFRNGKLEEKEIETFEFPIPKEKKK